MEKDPNCNPSAEKKGAQVLRNNLGTAKIEGNSVFS